MAQRFFLAGDEPTIRSCVAHRCDQHTDVPPVNSDGPDLSECGVCVGQRFVEAFEPKFWQLFWASIDSARVLMNQQQPGFGDAFMEQVRARVKLAQIDDEQLTKQ